MVVVDLQVEGTAFSMGTVHFNSPMRERFKIKIFTDPPPCNGELNEKFP